MLLIHCFLFHSIPHLNELFKDSLILLDFSLEKAFVVLFFKTFKNSLHLQFLSFNSVNIFFDFFNLILHIYLCSNMLCKEVELCCPCK